MCFQLWIWVGHAVGGRRKRHLCCFWSESSDWNHSLFGGGVAILVFSRTSWLIHQDSRKNRRIVLCHLLSLTAQLVDWQSTAVFSSPFLWQNNPTCHYHGSLPATQLGHPCCALAPWDTDRGERRGSAEGASEMDLLHLLLPSWSVTKSFVPSLLILPSAGNQTRPLSGSLLLLSSSPSPGDSIFKGFQGRQSPITCPTHDLYFLMFFLLSNLSLNLSPLLSLQWIVIFKNITYNFILKSCLELKHWILVYR